LGFQGLRVHLGFSIDLDLGSKELDIGFSRNLDLVFFKENRTLVFQRIWIWCFSRKIGHWFFQGIWIWFSKNMDIIRVLFSGSNLFISLVNCSSFDNTKKELNGAAKNRTICVSVVIEVKAATVESCLRKPTTGNLLPESSIALLIENTYDIKGV
jgi:hypothetical protein